MRRSAFFLLLAALSIPIASAQSKGGSPGAGGAPGGSPGSGSIGSGGIGSNPGRGVGTVAPSTRNPGTQNNSSIIQRPVFLSGKVMMDDGSPLPPNVRIQRVCGANPHTVAYTDSKGHFSFQWGQSLGVMSDASESGFGGRNSASSGGFGSAQSAGGSSGSGNDPFGNRMMNCELRADLAGYHSTTVNLFNRNSMDNPDVGSIILHRQANVEGTSISATSYLAPKDARKAYEHGLQALLKNKPEEASKDFEKAVAVYPKYADAWTDLGKLRSQQKSYDSAREALMKAIDADPKLVSPYVELGMMAAQEQKWEDSSQYLDRAIKLDPVDFPQAWYVDAVANFNLKKYDAAEKSAREAVKLDSRHLNPRADYLLGLVLAEKRDYSGAAAQFRSYLERSPDASDVESVRSQLGAIEKALAESNSSGKQP